MSAMHQALKMPQPEVLGIARYENDQYFLVNSELPGNPWLITTLWLAQYYIETNNRDEALKLIKLTKDRMMNTGVLPEQINPYDGKYVSVAPLIWSQSEYASTLLDLVSESD